MRFLGALLFSLFYISPISADETANPYLLPVADVNAKRLNGLALEDNADAVRLYREHARDYVKFREGQVTPAHAGLSPQQCQDGQPLHNPYCAYVGDDWKMTVLRTRFENEANDVKRAAPVTRTEYDQIVHSLLSSEMGDLEEVSEPTIRRVMKSFSQADDVVKIAETTLNESKCPPLNVLTAMGMKLEEFFPDKKYVDESIKVFSRVDQCAKNTDASGARARYRLALIQMLNSNCSAAEPVFRKLLDFRGDDGMVGRALYWMGRCSENSGHRIHADLFKTRILKWNPIGFHTEQIVESGFRSPLRLFTLSSQPRILLRSLAHPELNAIVRATEAIQESGSPQYARDLLTFLKSRAMTAEPEFQFYVALLCERSRDYIGKFQTLSRIFREHSELVSDETLRIFFPLRQMERIRQNHPTVDPLLVVSLIRQESGFNESALSPVGAIGLMQLMPYTARKMGVHGRRTLFSPDVNVRVGVKYFESLVRRFGGDTDLALAGYNAGPEKVDDWKRRYPTVDRVLFMDLIPFSETRNYVALIDRNYFWYQRLYRPASEPVGNPTADSARGPASHWKPRKKYKKSA